jgi:RNA polymerase II subunit A small phosphatase-like protein
MVAAARVKRRPFDGHRDSEPESMDRTLLIMDIDETLVYATEERGDADPDFQIFDYCVYKRPYLDEFLDRLFDWFDVAVWTSSGSSYAAELVARLFTDPDRLQFVWDERRCTVRRDLAMARYYTLKDLKKVKRRGYSLERVLMVDNTPRKLSRHYGNHLLLAPFEGDPTDRNLRAVLPYLEWLSQQQNLRSIDKRNWRKWKGPSA